MATLTRVLTLLSSAHAAAAFGRGSRSPLGGRARSYRGPTIRSSTATADATDATATSPAVVGDWETLETSGCKLLRPAGDEQPPKALIHFLGGAFVSPQPTVAYRYVLESLSRRGYAVLATPFAVDFDYAVPAADIKQKFSAAMEVRNGSRHPTS